MSRIAELETEIARLREANRRLQVEGPALERDKLIVELRTAVATARAEQRQRDAAAMCELCASGNKPIRGKFGNIAHWKGWSMNLHCDAAPIWKLEMKDGE